MTVRIGFLGAGLIAGFHAHGLEAARTDHRITVVYDPDPERAAAFAEQWSAEVVDDEAAVLDACDAVYICTWTSEHARLVDAACERGLAVFCEKPLAFDAAGAAAMADTVARAGVVNQVGLVLRRSPAFFLLRELVADPEAGRVMSFSFRDDQYIPVQGMYASTWRGDRRRAGAGTMLEHAIHDVDLLEHCLGPVASVSARSANFHGLDGIEDSVASVVELVGGAVGVHTTIWHDVVERPSLRRVEVFCERRHVVLDNDLFGPIRWTTAGDGAETVLEGGDLVAEARTRGFGGLNPDRAFVEAVLTGGPASPSFADAVRAHQIVDAVYASATAAGTPVTVRA